MESIHLEDPLISYFLGLLHTDGCHSGDVEHKGRVQIELSERDADVLRELARALPVKATLSTRTRRTNFTNEKLYTTCTLSIYAQEFRQWLSGMRMPAGPKSATVGPPTSGYSRHAYLRGVLDGDGSVGYTRADSPFISFVSASRDLAEFVADAIHETSGKRRTLNRNTRDGVFNVMVTNRAAAQLASYAWPSPEVIGITRKRAAGLMVADWTPPTGKATRYDVAKRKWTPIEDSIVLTSSDAEASVKTGRTMKSVQTRRWRLTTAEPLRTSD